MENHSQKRSNELRQSSEWSSQGRSVSQGNAFQVKGHVTWNALPVGSNSFPSSKEAGPSCSSLASLLGIPGQVGGSLCLVQSAAGLSRAGSSRCSGQGNAFQVKGRFTWERIARRLKLLSILELQRRCLQLSQFMRGFFSRKNQEGQRLQALREHSFDQLLLDVVPERQVPERLGEHPGLQRTIEIATHIQCPKALRQEVWIQGLVAVLQPQLLETLRQAPLALPRSFELPDGQSLEARRPHALRQGLCL